MSNNLSDILLYVLPIFRDRILFVVDLDVECHLGEKAQRVTFCEDAVVDAEDFAVKVGEVADSLQDLSASVVELDGAVGDSPQPDVGVFDAGVFFVIVCGLHDHI